MHTIMPVLVVISFVLTLTACETKIETSPTLPIPVVYEFTKVQTATEIFLTATSTTTPQLVPTVIEPLNGKQTLYEIDILLNFYNQLATVSQTTTYTNKTTSEIPEILFIVPPLAYPGSFSLTNLLDSSDETITKYIWEGSNLRIPLAMPLQPNEQVTFKMNYDLRLPAREGTFGLSGRQINLANWYPFIPPFEETSGWIADKMHVVNSFIVGEHLTYEISDFMVNLRFTDRRENMKIAAPTPLSESNGVLHYELPLARTFAMSISDVYVLEELTKDNITIQVYTFIGNEANAGATADLAAKSIALFSQIYSPYPRELFTVVEGEFEHNMEYDGIVFISNGVIQFHNGTSKTNLTMLIPHETSHQWFFSLVGNNQAQEPWLDEAFATYSEALFYQMYYPENLQWWWDNRVDFYDPQGFVNETIYFPNGYVPYRNAIYLQGARFFQRLRDVIGDDAYFAFLKDYVKKHSYKIATGQDFFATLAEHTQADISPVLSDYFKNP